MTRLVNRLGPLTFRIVTAYGTLKRFFSRNFNFQKADFVRLNSAFCIIKWSNNLDGKDVQDCYSTLCSNYIKHLHTFIPKKPPRPSKRRQPWSTEELFNLVK